MFQFHVGYLPSFLRKRIFEDKWQRFLYWPDVLPIIQAIVQKHSKPQPQLVIWTHPSIPPSPDRKGTALLYQLSDAVT